MKTRKEGPGTVDDDISLVSFLSLSVFYLVPGAWSGGFVSSGVLSVSSLNGTSLSPLPFPYPLREREEMYR